MMTNKEMIIELQYAIDLIKQNGQDWLDERDIPILEAAISALQAQDEEQREEPLYCDRDICLRNEYNGIGCEECEVTKSQKNLQQVTTDTISRRAVISYIDRIMHQGTGKNKSFEYIKKYVEKLQSAQPEIIYCKDCLHAIKDALCGGYWCKGKAVTSNHYCGYAERRTDD